MNRLARGSALRSKDAPTRFRGYADLFDAVQALAVEQEVAGDFEQVAERSAHAGPWDWRAFLAEALEEPVSELASLKASLIGYH